MTQTAQAVTAEQLQTLRDRLASSDAVSLEPVSLAVVDATTTIPRAALADPWDRLIVGTARSLQLSLVTRDEAIRDSELVPTIW